jgi:hypothetical protein
MHQERAKIHLYERLLFQKFSGSYTPGPPWREGATPSAPTPSTASPCAGARNAPGSADPDLVCTPMLSLTPPPPKHEILGNSLIYIIGIVGVCLTKAMQPYLAVLIVEDIHC